MALKTSGRIFTRIHYELPDPASRLNVFAAGAVARFAAGKAGQLRRLNMHARMRTRWEASRNVRMTIKAGLVADVTGAGNFGGCHNRPIQTGAGTRHYREHDRRARYYYNCGSAQGV
jgi:hypothetical protein